jgi:phosphomannomutase
MSSIIRFGTDGWRGRIADDYTFANVRRVTQGLSEYFSQMGHRGKWVVVGYDRRFQSEYFAEAAAEVLLANDFKVFLMTTATPTPAISHAVIQTGSIGAVNITASHNPPTDNGFKVRDHRGGAIDPTGLKAIEKLIPTSDAAIQRIRLSAAETQGKFVRYDPIPAYVDQLNQLVDLEALKRSGLKVLVDPMWGNGSGFFPFLIGGGNTLIEEIHTERNPIFPEMTRPEPIPPNVDVGLRELVQRGSDVLLITDGDADRLGLGDEKGCFIDQLRVFGLLAFYFLEVRQERGAIVKTLSTTHMLNKLGQLYNVPVHETGVGFKYVAPKMIESNAMIGGEESGGYAFRGHVPERDGILAGLFVLDMLRRLDKKPTEVIDLLFEKVGVHYYDRIDTRFSGNRQEREKFIVDAKPDTIGSLRVKSLNTTDGYKFELEDGGFLLIRFSGTEPIIRVYTETLRGDLVKAILEDGLRIAKIV